MDINERRRIWQLPEASPPLDDYVMVIDKEPCCTAVQLPLEDLVVFLIDKIKIEKQTGLNGFDWVLEAVVAKMLVVFRNGVAQTPDDDYSLAGDTVTFALQLDPAEKLLALYLPVPS